MLKQVCVIYVRADFLLILICLSSPGFSYLRVGGVTCLIKQRIASPASLLGKDHPSNIRDKGVAEQF